MELAITIQTSSVVFEVFALPLCEREAYGTVMYALTWPKLYQQYQQYRQYRRKANWIGHILRRNCLLKRVIEGKIKGEMEVTRRRGRRRKKLLDDTKDRRGYSHLKEEALDRTMWRNRFGGSFGLVVRQNTEWINETDNSRTFWTCSLSGRHSIIFRILHSVRHRIITPNMFGVFLNRPLLYDWIFWTCQ